MNRNSRWRRNILLCACAILAATEVPAAYTDPIETPAIASALAAHSILVADTRTPGGSWVAVGRRGHILLSKDAVNWKQSTAVPVRTDLVGVYFASATHGWAVGHGGVILATTDGGNTWVKQLDGRKAAALLVSHYQALATNSTDPEISKLLDDAKRFQENGPGRPFLDVWFADTKRGYAIGAYNLLFATEDGGASWTPQPERLKNPKGMHLNAIRAVGNDVYIAGEQGLLARLNPSSGNFEVIKTPYPGTFFGLIGREGLLVLFGLQGTVLRSSDRGATWQKLDTGLSSTIASGTMLDDGRLVLAGQEGRLAVGTADANHFTAVLPAKPGSIFGVAPGAGAGIVLVGGRGVTTQKLP